MADVDAQKLFKQFDALNTIEAKHKFVDEQVDKVSVVSMVREFYIRHILVEWVKIFSNLEYLTMQLDRLAKEEIEAD